jgi:Peptidase M15
VNGYVRKRSEKRNTQVGGAGLSWHKYGLAADVVLDDAGDKAGFIERAKKLFPFVLDEGDHIHVQGMV